MTVATLVAISGSLGRISRGRGEDTGELGARSRCPCGRNSSNNFRNVGVGLYPELNRDDHAARIGAGGGVAAPPRPTSTAMRASAAAFAAVQPPLLRWGMGKFDPTVRASEVTGNTVVIQREPRGPADLTFGGRRVLFTAGYPALSPMMS